MIEGPIRIIVPTGSLGAGAVEAEMEYGLSRGAHAIATDAGSTDSGAAYLALGISKNNRGSVRRDLVILMKAAARAKIPLIIGTAGQAGGDKNVDWTRDIVLEVAAELGVKPKIALLYSGAGQGGSQDEKCGGAHSRAGTVRALAGFRDRRVRPHRRGARRRAIHRGAEGRRRYHHRRAHHRYGCAGLLLRCCMARRRGPPGMRPRSRSAAHSARR